jgi:hypothetical protein
MIGVIVGGVECGSANLRCEEDLVRWGGLIYPAEVLVARGSSGCEPSTGTGALVTRVHNA